jgi:hypothetical protein
LTALGGAACVATTAWIWGRQGHRSQLLVPEALPVGSGISGRAVLDEPAYAVERQL